MLILFDIDGTLLGRATAAHSDALHHALSAVHGLGSAELAAPVIAAAGRTDPEIARLILLSAGVPAARIDERAGTVRQECARAYARLCPADLSHTVLPGIADLLQWLSGHAEPTIRRHEPTIAGHPELTLGLLTGNYEPVARLKLARAGIGRHFHAGQGAFGSDSEDRAALPAIARRRAGPRGVSYPREHTIVIGDTPRDIACARADRVKCLAVATGPYGAAELTDADEVHGDARELRGALASTLGVSP